MKIFLLSTIICIFLISCAVETGGGGFRTDDKEYTKYLLAELKNKNIIYTIDSEGFIKYDESEKEKFKKAQNQVQHILYEGSSSKPTKPEDTEFLVNLLKKNNLEYYILEKPDGTWVKWYPKDEEHRQKIMLQVVENNFSKQMAELSDCKNPCSKKTSNKAVKRD